MNEPAGFPVTITDDCGDEIVIEAKNGEVRIYTPGPYVGLDAAGREQFSQAYIAACHEADRQSAGAS